MINKSHSSGLQRVNGWENEISPFGQVILILLYLGLVAEKYTRFDNAVKGTVQ